MNNNRSSQELAEFEQVAQALLSQMFALCEKRILETKGKQTPAHTALAASALALQSAVAAFLAIERTCK